MVKILNKIETLRKLKSWVRSDGPNQQAYYLLTLQEAMEVELDRETLIIIRCPQPVRKPL